MYTCICSVGTSQGRMRRFIRPWRPSGRQASSTTMECSASAPQLCPHNKLAGEMVGQSLMRWFKIWLHNLIHLILSLVVSGLFWRTTGRRWLIWSWNLVLEVIHSFSVSSPPLYERVVNSILNIFFVLMGFHSREGVSGPLQGGVGQNSGPGGCTEKVAQQALRGGTAASWSVHVWQEKHHHCLWTGVFSIFSAVRVKKRKDKRKWLFILG